MFRLWKATVIAVIFWGLYQEGVTTGGTFSKILKANSHYAEYQDRSQFYEGDIKVSKHRRRSPRAASNEKRRIWPGGNIPYIIADDLERVPGQAAIVRGAIAEWERKTCIKFVKRTTQRNFVRFYYGQGCNSEVGLEGAGEQTTSLGKGCEDHGIAVHELGHLIGLYHEQNRIDRDKYVDIIWDNVLPRYFYAFEKKDDYEVNSRGVPYDHYSVMHYKAYDFSKNNKPTIRSKVPGITEFGNSHVSPRDAEVVNLMYNCPEIARFPQDYYWRHYGLSRRDTTCIHVFEPKDSHSWENNYLCRRQSERKPIGLKWSHQGPINGMSCVKAVAPSKQGRDSWDDNYFCWPKDSVYKFEWKTSKPKQTERRSCLKITEPRDRAFTRRRHYLCGKKDESPVDGGWSEWTEWSRCSRQCGGGFHRRFRKCNNPQPAFGGKSCKGESSERGRCAMQSCGSWPVFPKHFVYDFFTFPPDDKLCIRTYERFDYFTWSNYLFCTPDDMKDPEFDWSDEGPIPNMKCIKINNPTEALYTAGTWDNNYLCMPKGSPYNLVWSLNGPIKGKKCLQWRPKNGKDGWDKGHLCNDNSNMPAEGDPVKDKPVHGGWTTWARWNRCSRTCGGGFQRRERNCINPAPQHGGRPCIGKNMEKRRCNMQRCTVDGSWSFWSPWGRCTKSCGGGEQTRKRTCSNPAPQNGGRPCSGLGTQRRRCNDKRCPINGGWSAWSWWARCSKTCGGGVQARSRTCNKPRPKYGGKYCIGKHVETRSCMSRGCPIDGQWAAWASWRACSKSCSGGIQIRTRSCTNPAPRNGGRPCFYKSQEEKRCNTQPCPIHGAWSKWSSWQDCTKSCGGGTQKRVRTCTNPLPRHGGSLCFGDDLQTKKCGTKPCPLPPVHGKWSSWSSWKSCTKTCAGGIQQRVRTCTNPKPQHGGRTCKGRSVIEKRCNTQACPRSAARRVDGQWSSWQSWSRCTKSCGSGNQRRTRTCTNPRPSFGGRTCRGSRLQQRYCNIRSCRVDGRWTSWTPWGSCSVSCGGGSQRRTRSCSNPRPSGGGRNCYGGSYESRSCNRQSCRVDGKWSSWSSWGTCSKTCGNGVARRTRSCSNPTPKHGGRSCSGRSWQTKRCNARICPTTNKPVSTWGSWKGWSKCSRSCNGGIQRRIRKCNRPHGGPRCAGRNYEDRRCNTFPCPICGGNLSRYTGRIRSPRYPRTYQPNLDCVWAITARKGYRVELKIRSFRLENGGASCSQDYLEIRDGQNVSSPRLARFCGSQRTKIISSTGRYMWVKFHSNYRIGYRGFAATYYQRKIPKNLEAKALKGSKADGSGCGGTRDENHGYLKSPRYPASYPAGLDCKWIIKVDPGRQIRFFFSPFQIYHNSRQRRCGDDYVSLRDGPPERSRFLGRHCRRPPDVRFTKSNILTVRFRSGSHSNRRRPGFRMYWRSFPNRSPATGRPAIRNKNKEGGCDTGWTPSPSPSRSFCYKQPHSSSQRLAWTDAQRACRQWEAELVTIESREEQDFIRSRVLPGAYMWLGYTDRKTEGKWVWQNEFVSTTGNYTNWAPGEPNNGKGNEHCAMMKPDGVWNDWPCTYKFKVLCKKNARPQAE